MSRIDQTGEELLWIPVKNVGASEIPSYGLVQITGMTSDGIFEVERPDTDSQDVIVNGPGQIGVNEFGEATRSDPCFAYYDTGDGTPANGEAWGAGAGSYKLRKTKTGFTVVGGAANEFVHVVRAAGSGGSGTVTSVTLTQPAAGLTITDSGVAITTSGTRTFALANDLSALEGLGSTGIAARTAADTWAQRTITGTADKITVTDGNGVSGNPTITIAATYAGQNTITTVGTIGTGTWNGTAIGPTYGGTGLTGVTTGQILYGSASNTWAGLNIGSYGAALRIGTGGIPTWLALWKSAWGIPQADSTSGTLVVHGFTSWSITGTPSNEVNARGQYIGLASSASANSIAGLSTGSIVVSVHTAQTPVGTWIVEFPNSTDIATDSRCWIGWCDAPGTILGLIGGQDTLNNVTGAAFRCCSGTTDTKWMCCVNDGGATAATAVDSGVTVSEDTRYVLQIDATDNTSIKFFINGTLVHTATSDLPGTTTRMAHVFGNQVAAGMSAKNIFFGLARQDYVN